MRIIVTCIALCLSASPLLAQGDSMVVTLLGTGTPIPRMDRLGPATLVEAGRHRLLFDAGRGTTIRLEEAGIKAGSIRAVFLTHHHSDHTNGLPDLWLTGWLPLFGGRTAPLRLVGPAGTNALATGLTVAFAEDIRMRVAEEKLPGEGARINPLEFHKDTVVFDEDGVRVTSFEVDHGGAMRPAYGYRINYRGRTVVISGDTRYSDNLMRAAVGADVIMHEVAMAPADILNLDIVKFILGHHTSPAEAGRLFAAAKPRLAVFTHLAFPPSRMSATRIGPDDVLAEARKYYVGRMEVGGDLMRIVVGDAIRVERRSPVR